MDKSTIENLRKFYELTYQQQDSSAVVVVEMGEVDYANNDTIKEFNAKGYRLFDSNKFGTMIDGTIGEFLVFVKR